MKRLTRWIALTVFASLLGVGALFCVATQPAPAQTAHQFATEVTRPLRARYLLFLPRDYQSQGEKKWPLILFLHGAGERGDDLERVKTHGPPKLVESQPDFPFIVVSPQLPNGELWSNEVLLALLDKVVSEHKVDEARIYLTGLSMGGYGSWSLAAAAPERFAAVAPICGGGSGIWALRLRGMPIWAFHGAKDRVVPVEESQRMVDALKRFRGDARLTIYPDAGHDSWTETYANPELYEWFLSHSRP